MNYPANTIDHQIGAQVIHDYDAKRPDMLMIVIAKFKTKDSDEITYATVYLKKIPPPGHDHHGKNKKIEVWHNYVQYLHDPKNIPNFGKSGQ